MARSKRGGITFSLVRDRDGLPVTPEGKLTRSVPASLAGQEVTALIVVKGGSDLERFWILTSQVEGPSWVDELGRAPD